MKKIRWGVLSTARIGRMKVIPAMQNGKFSEISAIASRGEERSRAAAKELGIPKAYGSYEALLADPDIDAIYIPVPNHLHIEWTLKCLAAGKHVLCEKPIGLNADAAEKLLTATQEYPDLKVMEAFMYRFHPQWQKARSLVEEGAIGKLRTIHSIFSYFNNDPGNVRNQADIGGGALLDIGCYGISLARFIFGKEPLRVSGAIDFDPDLKVDRLASAVLAFEDGTSTFTCATQLFRQQHVGIIGENGRIEIPIPFNAPPDAPTKILHHYDNQCHEYTFDICDQYTIQGDRFSQAILENTEVPTPLSDAVANMKVIDAVFESAKHGRWITL